MKPVEFVGQTALVAAPDNHRHDKLPIGKLPIQKIVYQFDEGYIWTEFSSCWKPSAEELAVLNDGGIVKVSVIGSIPPIKVEAEKVEILP